MVEVGLKAFERGNDMNKGYWIEFDSYEIALAAYESDDHKKALAALGPGVERDFRIAEGV
jgi:uncharacterized protein (DUF1330 family)